MGEGSGSFTEKQVKENTTNGDGAKDDQQCAEARKRFAHLVQLLIANDDRIYITPAVFAYFCICLDHFSTVWAFL
jgi:hypothetical protein